MNNRNPKIDENISKDQRCKKNTQRSANFNIKSDSQKNENVQILANPQQRQYHDGGESKKSIL
jgi:hypothetical protein